MKEMFSMLAKTCEIFEKTQKIENENTRKYVHELTTILFRLGVNIYCIEALIEKYIELNEDVGDLYLDMIEFYKKKLGTE